MAADRNISRGFLQLFQHPSGGGRLAPRTVDAMEALEALLRRGGKSCLSSWFCFSVFFCIFFVQKKWPALLS